MTALKAIVLGLALANVGFFLWHGGIASPHPAEASVAGQPMPTLKLASEVAAGASAPGPQRTESSGETLAAGAGQTAAGTGNSGAATLITHVSRCVTVGPFKDVSDAAHAATTLRHGGYDPRQRVIDGDVWAGVWVYLPIPSTRPAADQMLAKLKAAGIDDALEMPGPIDGSVISLGLYNDQKRAQARVAQAQSLGFNPGLADRKRSGNAYWIDVDLKPTEGLLNPADLQGEAGRGSRLEVKACPVSPPPS